MLSYSDTLWQTIIPNSHKRLPFSYLATWMLVLSRVKYLLPLKEEKWTPPGQNFCFDKTEVAPFPGLKRFQFMEMRSLAELNEKQLSKGRQRTDLWIRSIHRIHNHTTKDDFQCLEIQLLVLWKSHWCPFWGSPHLSLLLILLQYL